MEGAYVADIASIARKEVASKRKSHIRDRFVKRQERRRKKYDKDHTELIRDRTVQGERKKTKIANGVYCGKKSQGKIGAILRICMMYAEWTAEGNRLFAFRRVT